MAFMKRDWRYGVPYYKFVGDSDATELAAVFNEGTKQLISKIFGTLKYVHTYTEAVDTGSGTAYETVYQIVPIGLTAEEIRDDFQTEFENCQWMVPFYFNSDEGNAAAVSRLNKILTQVLNENEYKYRMLADSLGYAYDPVATFFERNFGADTLGRVYNDIVDLKEVSGPIYDIQYDQETHEITSFKFDQTRKLESSGIDGSQTTKGGAYTGSSSTTTISGNTINTTNSINMGAGTQNKTSVYTTTQDSATTGRLQGYNTDEGTVAQAGDFIRKDDLPVVGRVQSGKQNPDYTDTKTYGQRKTGRNGIAPELIEAHRNLARFSIEKEFFNDLKKKMLVAGWD